MSAVVDPAGPTLDRGASVRRLAAAPHRLMFFAGTTNVLLAMVWWAAWLVATRWPDVLAVRYPPVFPGWLHAFVMQYQMLPSFIFGFLLTTFPKWTKQPEVTRARFLPVGVALVAGQLATLAGALGSHTAIVAGVALTLAGWTAALSVLAPMLWREDGVTWHARSCVAALALGYLGILAFGAFLLGGSAAWVPASIKLGSFGLSLLVFFTVAHRMFPFFASNIVAGYVPWRPLWLLAAVWLGVVLHLALALLDAYRWLWLPDAALLVLATIAWLRWWPRGPKPGLLVVLFLGLAWLPIAMALYTIDGLAYAATGASLLGRAPAHALFVGFFGSVLIAMVTRVTQGHSGRPLVMPRAAWFAFVAIQLVAIVRMIGDLTRDPYAWFAIAAIGWLVAFAPWVARLGRIYLTPRVDQKPG
ncbi:MAG TPA: NnrS family protein [Kofleriaceae bacterium]|nr:NnrS family protein [Kofleriaceae bacterium]